MFKEGKVNGGSHFAREQELKKCKAVRGSEGLKGKRRKCFYSSCFDHKSMPGSDEGNLKTRLSLS